MGGPRGHGAGTHQPLLCPLETDDTLAVNFNPTPNSTAPRPQPQLRPLLAAENGPTQDYGYSTKADIYSFGITALELINGITPYHEWQSLKVCVCPRPRDYVVVGPLLNQKAVLCCCLFLKTRRNADPVKQAGQLASAAGLLSARTFTLLLQDGRRLPGQGPSQTVRPPVPGCPKHGPTRTDDPTWAGALPQAHGIRAPAPPVHPQGP